MESATVRQDLATLVGRPDLDEITVLGTLAETPDNSLLEKHPEQWLGKHPSAAMARAFQEQAEMELRRARLEPYPDVSVGVSGGREGFSDSSIVEFRVGLPLPIFDRSKGRKREAQANAGVAQAELVATEHRLLKDWRIASRRFQTAAEQVATYRDRILPKVTNALKLVQIGFQEGKFGFIDLIDTQRTTAEARLAYQQKLLELNIAQADLQALAGKANPGELKFPNSFDR
jgi:cobalt-zinc-cadmium efflux system outer membrane protein